MKWTIYLIRCRENEKVYIGQTVKTPEKRFDEHVKNKHSCVLLKRAIEKHGAENFDILTLKECSSQAEADQVEIEQIADHCATDPEFGYNILAGGRGGHRTWCKRGHDLTLDGARVSESDGSCKICKLDLAKQRLERVGLAERTKAGRKHRAKVKARRATDPTYDALCKQQKRERSLQEYDDTRSDPEAWALYLEKKRESRRRNPPKRTKEQRQAENQRARERREADPELMTKYLERVRESNRKQYEKRKQAQNLSSKTR